MFEPQPTPLHAGKAMRSLGIRAEPKKATFVIYDDEAKQILNVESLIIPQILNKPEQLKFARHSILDILREYEVDVAGIRVAEGNSQNQDADRLYLEAVFMESFASSSIKSYFVGRKTSISARLGITAAEFASIVKCDTDLDDVDGWPAGKAQAVREAILVAVGATR
ncbi:hypothetical protein ACO2TB_24635 [Pseudomonas putida]